MIEVGIPVIYTIERLTVYRSSHCLLAGRTLISSQYNVRLKSSVPFMTVSTGRICFGGSEEGNMCCTQRVVNYHVRMILNGMCVGRSPR